MESWFFRRYSYEQKIYINLYIFLVLTEINCHGDLPLSISWNWDGSRFATTCKDKSLRVIDPRTGNVVAEKKKAHEGNKTSKCIFLKSGKIFTLGFSKRCDRQYGLWDPVCISYNRVIKIRSHGDVKMRLKFSGQNWKSPDSWRNRSGGRSFISVLWPRIRCSLRSWKRRRFYQVDIKLVGKSGIQDLRLTPEASGVLKTRFPNFDHLFDYADKKIFCKKKCLKF